MQLIVKGDTSRPILFPLVLASDHVSPATGLTPTVLKSTNGGGFGAIAGSVAEVAYGWYKITPGAGDVGTEGFVVFHVTASTADPTDVVIQVIAVNPYDATAGGISRLDAAVTSRAAPGDPMELDSDGITDVQTALTNQGLTAARAGYLDTIFTNVSSFLDYSVQDVSTELAAVGARIPAALVAGRMDSYAGAIGTDVITSDTIDVDAISAGAVSAAAVTKIQAGLAVPGDAMELDTDGIADVQTALTNQGYSAARAIKLDNLDTNVASRSNHTAADVSTAISTAHGVGSYLTATGFAVAGDAMELDADGIADVQTALTNQGLTAVRAGKLDNLDAAVTTRATQAQILSDATPFAGANIARLDAAVTSRSQPGDPMDLVAGAVTSTTIANGAITYQKFDAGAITANAIDSNAITSGKFAANAINGAALDATAITKIQTGLATSVALTAVDGKLPAALVGGKMDSHINDIANNAITSLSIAAGAIASGKIGAGAITPTEAPNLDAAVTSRATQAQIISDATPFPGARIDAAITSRATQAQILSDATPFPGARIDATITSRATQAQILSDATPFPGARINATITSRSAPGDDMGITVAGKAVVQSAVQTAVIENGMTLEDILRILLAIMTGKSDWSGSPTIVTFRDSTDTVNRATFEMNGSKRVVITFDLTPT